MSILNFTPQEIKVLNALSFSIDEAQRDIFKDEFLSDQKRISTGKWGSKVYTIAKSRSVVNHFLYGVYGATLGTVAGAFLGIFGVGFRALTWTVYGGGAGSVLGLTHSPLLSHKVTVKEEDDEYNHWLVTHKLMPVLFKYAELLSGKKLSPTCSLSEGIPFRHPVRSLDSEGMVNDKLLEGEDLTPEKLESTVFDYFYFLSLINKISDIFDSAILKSQDEADKYTIDQLRFAIIGYNNSGGARQIIEERYKSHESRTYSTNDETALANEEWKTHVKIFTELKKLSADQICYKD